MSRLSPNLKHSLGPLHEFTIDGDAENSTEYGWRDLTADLSGRGQGATAPVWASYRDGISQQRFDKGDEVSVVFHPNHDVIPGELCYPHIHWSTNSTTATGTVVWCIEYMIAEGHDTDNFPATTTIEMTYTFTANKQYRHFITECSDAQAITMPDVDSLIVMRVYRKDDAADTFAGNVFGHTVDIHYRAGKFATKGKRPDFNVAD